MAGEKAPRFSEPLPPPDAGLCASCRHLRVQRGGRSLFVRCALARIDPAFPRYPRLPVLVCAGHERPPQT